MARLRPWLLRVLALVLFAQAGLAGAACLAAMPGAGALAVEICSPDGTRILLLDGRGEPGEPDGQGAPHGGFCAVCLAAPALTPKPPAAVPAPRAAPIVLPNATAAAPPDRAAFPPPYPSRAPPGTV